MAIVGRHAYESLMIASSQGPWIVLNRHHLLQPIATRNSFTFSVAASISATMGTRRI